MAGIAAAIIGAGALSAGGMIYGAKTAANAQTNASRNAISAEQQIYNQNKEQLQPFINAGQSALPTLQSLLTPGANQTATLNQIPGFTFAQDWGQKAVQNLGTTRGLGGNVLTAGANYATGLAQQGWGNIVNSLQGLVNTGSGAAGALAGVGATTGGQIGGQMVGIGNAQAGAATAIGSAAGNFGNSISTAALLQKLTGSNGMYGSQGAAGANTGAPGGGYYDATGGVQPGPGYYP